MLNKENVISIEIHHNPGYDAFIKVQDTKTYESERIDLHLDEANTDNINTIVNKYKAMYPNSYTCSFIY